MKTAYLTYLGLVVSALLVLGLWGCANPCWTPKDLMHRHCNMIG